jgi:streptomycin 6-kinase
MIHIPEGFARTTVEVFGEKGREWLKQLPTVLKEYEERWSLRVQSPFSNLTYNYVLPAYRTDGMECVLKLGVPCGELQNEMQALQYYNGEGIVKLLEADLKNGAMLLERLAPGASLASMAEEQAASIMAQVMKKLWKPAPEHHSFPSIAKWAKGLERLRTHFEGGTGPFPKELVEKAEALFPQLIKSISSPLLLHGDLHHDNVLSAEREPWLAIDPKGVIGEAEYETVAYLRNQLLTRSNPKQVLKRRVDQLSSDLQLDRERMLSWGLCHCVLSSWWTVEDHGYGWEDTMMVAELFDSLLQKR